VPGQWLLRELVLQLPLVRWPLAQQLLVQVLQQAQ
jgi:hypothetical protein